jgi:hypothetical protein
MSIKKMTLYSNQSLYKAKGEWVKLLVNKRNIFSHFFYYFLAIFKPSSYKKFLKL